MSQGNKVSIAVIRRLPRYYRYLSDLQYKGVTRISSNALGKAMGLTASQIRQDLSCFGKFGQQGFGYKVSSVREKVAEIMGIHRGHKAIVVGVGNLGRAIMENFPFGDYGFEVLSAFDVNEEVVGTKIKEVPVLPVAELASFLDTEEVQVAVVSVPRSVAQSTANLLVEAGVTGIWNFTNIEITVDKPEVVVESVHFSDSLLALSYMISPRSFEDDFEDEEGEEE